jgi:hypothetical protein
MKMTKNELKNIIKECVDEVLTENSQPVSFDTFNEAWEYCRKIGVPTTVVTEKQWNLLMEDVVNTNDDDEASKLLLED